MTGDQGMGGLEEPPIHHKTTCIAAQATVDKNLRMLQDDPKHRDMFQTRTTSNGATRDCPERLVKKGMHIF